MEYIIFPAICLGMALIFWLIALVAFKRRTPMHFWAGDIIDPKTIKDIPAYNRANGVMWLVYGVSYIVAGLVGFASIIASVVLLSLASTVGIAGLFVAYKRIHNKYKA